MGNKSIKIHKNEANETIIEFGFAALKNVWANNRKNIVEAYREVIKFINNPPILVSLEDERLRVSSQNILRGSSSGMTEKIITEA